MIRDSELFSHWSFESFTPGSIPRLKYNAFRQIHRQTNLCFSLLARFEELSMGRAVVDWCRVSGLAARLSNAIRDLVDQLQIMNPVEFMDAHDWVAKLSFYTRLATEHTTLSACPPYLVALDSLGAEHEHSWMPHAPASEYAGPALVATPSLYQYFVEANDLRDRLDSLLGRLDVNNAVATKELGGQAQALIRGGILPQRLQAELEIAAVELAPGGKFIEFRIFAGAGGDAVLIGEFGGVRPADFVSAWLEAVACKFSPSALALRLSQGLADDEHPLTVIAYPSDRAGQAQACLLWDGKADAAALVSRLDQILPRVTRLHVFKAQGEALRPEHCRSLHEQAKRHSPCIIFVDEIDAVGRQRGAGLGGSHDEREQTLNQMLVEMDGFDTDTNVIIMAATNRPDILDPALMRPGRFDRRVTLDRPDVKGREAILRVHIKGKPLEPEADLASLARATPGFTGADLENLVNEAAILAARRNKKSIGQPEMEEAIERVVMGPERKSRLISEEEKRIIAYHEAGHAVVANAIAEADPVQKVTIVGRGQAGGVTWFRPNEDRILMSRKKMMATLAYALGGRAAEELIFDDITSGASNDIEQVTRMARAMVTRLGMSSDLGPMVYGQAQELVFLGREISEQRDYSDDVANQIDREVRKLIDEAYGQARAILAEYREKLDEIANRLLEVETITREEFEAIFPAPSGKKSGTPQPSA